MGTHSQSKQATSSQNTYMYNTFPFYSCVLCILSRGVEEERDLENHYISFSFQLVFTYLNGKTFVKKYEF